MFGLKKNNKQAYKALQNINFDDFKNYLCSYSDDDILLTPTGWKLLIDKVLSPVIEKELGLIYLGGYCWADAYSNHRRRVLKLFLINQKYATFQWGWNFDFIPKCVGKNLVWARTDKSIYSHIFEVSDDFYKNTKNRKNTVISAGGAKINDFQKSMNTLSRSYIDVFYFLLPKIKTYFDKTDTYENTLADIHSKLLNDYYIFINPDFFISRVFIESFLGRYSSAIMHFNDIRFRDENIKNKYLSKLEGMKNIQSATNEL